MGDPLANMQPSTHAGTEEGFSAWRAVSLLNQSLGVVLMGAIALIINYLGVPLGMAFTGVIFS